MRAALLGWRRRQDSLGALACRCGFLLLAGTASYGVYRAAKHKADDGPQTGGLGKARMQGPESGLGVNHWRPQSPWLRKRKSGVPTERSNVRRPEVRYIAIPAVDGAVFATQVPTARADPFLRGFANSPWTGILVRLMSGVLVHRASRCDAKSAPSFLVTVPVRRAE